MDWVKKIVYAHAGISLISPPSDSEEFIEIGEYQIGDCPELVDHIASAVLTELHYKRKLVERFAPSQISQLPTFLSPLDFIYPLEDGKNIKRQRETPLLDSPRNCSSYLSYLEKNFSDLASFFFTRLQFRIPEEARKKHTYILGGSGSGKSEILKVLMYQYIKRKNRKTTVILFDPHGDVALQVGRWKEHINGENIVYIDPSLKQGYMPCINPLEIPENASPAMINYMSECLTEVFKEIVGGDSNITANMGTMLKAVLTVLLKKPDTTLKDFQTFMRDDENQALVEYAKKNSSLGQKHFFENGFYDSNYTPTKRALYTKVQDLFNSQSFYDLTVGKSTINVRVLMDSRKTIIFRLSKGKIGEQTSSAFGRFLLALMQGFSFQRQDTPEKERIPTHVFLDEFHNFVTPSIQTILDESRKYGLHLTLVQQFFGQKTDTQLRASIMNNTAIKICGTGEDSTLEKMARVMTGVTKEELQNCERGQFYIKVKKQGGLIQQAFGTNYARPFRNTTALLGFRNSMPSEAWQKVKKQQLQEYYRPLLEMKKAQVEHGVDHQEFSTNKKRENDVYISKGLSQAQKKKSVEKTIQNTKQQLPDWYTKNIKPEKPVRASTPLPKENMAPSPSSQEADNPPMENNEGNTSSPVTPKFNL